VYWLGGAELLGPHRVCRDPHVAPVEIALAPRPHLSAPVSSRGGYLGKQVGEGANTLKEPGRDGGSMGVSHGLAPTAPPRGRSGASSRTCRRLRPLVRASAASQGLSSSAARPDLRAVASQASGLSSSSPPPDLRAVALGGVRPRVDSTAWVAPNCVVLGDVRLGPHSSVWFGCTLRGDNNSITIGENCNVQEHSVLHCDAEFPLCIGRDSTIGHLVMLHGCQVGDRCLIGMGAVVLNGVTIGAGSIVGAGALIPQGKTIPPNSLVLGNPGKVVRQTGEKDWAMIKHGVEFYRHNAQRLRAELAEPQAVLLPGGSRGGAHLATELEKLWALKGGGALTMAEFQTAKAAILAALR
jgi:carbonic anhydrase/acetyltransferase-like protein (isoleucine patch superfamily)